MLQTAATQLQQTVVRCEFGFMGERLFSKETLIFM